MNRTLIVSAIALTTLSACAKRPDAIAPTAIPFQAYENLSCDALATELRVETQNLAVLSKAQNNAATGDAVGVFLIGVPTSSLTGGDKEGEISVAKGKIQSIEAVRRNKSCPAV